MAKEEGLKSAVFTFANHPKNLKKGALEVKNILYFDEKAKILEDMGVDYLFNIPFDEKIKKMEPIEFIDDILIDKFNMKQAFCGFNFRFGHKASGNPEILMKEGIDKGFGIHILEPFKIDGKVVSSTYIRQIIADGRVDLCPKYMGRYYTIDGEVVVGNKIGRTIGFPTSNLVIDENMITPPNGVYVTLCVYNGVKYPSITNVGVKPTIGTYGKNVETHIFNFNKELYGKHIRVEFLEKTRDERKFESKEELGRQIEADCIMAKAFHRGMNLCNTNS